MYHQRGLEHLLPSLALSLELYHHGHCDLQKTCFSPQVFPTWFIHKSLFKEQRESSLLWRVAGLWTRTTPLGRGRVGALNGMSADLYPYIYILCYAYLM